MFLQHVGVQLQRKVMHAFFQSFLTDKTFNYDKNHTNGLAARSSCMKMSMPICSRSS